LIELTERSGFEWQEHGRFAKTNRFCFTFFFLALSHTHIHTLATTTRNVGYTYSLRCQRVDVDVTN
jgi:hypothetical protein